MKTAFLCFFPVIPTNMGSAEVIRSLFLCWPGQKKLFQITHLKDRGDKNVKSFKIFREKPILKIFTIPLVIISILKYLNNSKNKIIIIEGPSWIGYSFISLILIKIFSPSSKIIYHSHSIEYEVRKMTSSKMMVVLTKILEKIVFKYSDITTSVSQIEIGKIKKLYNVNAFELNNGISKKIIKFSKKKKLNFNYIIYCGSYKYAPNKYAIDFLIEKIMPLISKIYPSIKLVLTGGGYNEKKKFLINLGIVKKSYLLNLIYNSKAMVVPLEKGTGTRIKIIEALLIGGNVLTTPKGAEGINFDKKKGNNLIIVKKENFIKELKKFFNQRKKIDKKKFQEEYLMENIIYKFINREYVKNFIKKN